VGLRLMEGKRGWEVGGRLGDAAVGLGLRGEEVLLGCAGGCGLLLPMRGV
jgi:hypothetical protein